MSPPAELPLAVAPAVAGPAPAAAARRIRTLAWGGIAWHVVEAAVAIVAGAAAGSIALIGFGADSLIEALAGFVLLWRFGGARAGSAAAELRAQRLVAASFVLLAGYVGVEAIRALTGGDAPEASWPGIALAAVTLVTMPLLARAKARAGHAAGSSSAVSESRQTVLCAYLSGALLVGLGGNALFGLWWLDPAAALVIAAAALREAREAWRGDACACC